MERLHELISGLLIVDIAQILCITAAVIALVVITARERRHD